MSKDTKKHPTRRRPLARASPPSPLRGEGYAKPRPRVGPDNAPFWQGCREHRLLLPTCRACGKAHLPPGPVCPFCFGDDIAWRPASGRGRISTWTKVHKSWFPAFADETPYTVVQVELDEGPRLTSRLVDAGDEPIAIGARVEAVFTDVDADLTLHGFRLNAPEWRPAIDLAQSSRSVRPGINAADHGGHHAHSPRLRRPSPRRCRL